MTMAQKRNWDEEKIRFWVFGIFSVVLYQESLCEYFMAISKVFFEIWPFIYKPHYKPCFCFQLIFYYFLISSPGHRPYELLSWVSVSRPSVNFSHLNFLLWNHWTELNQACQKCSLDGSLPDLCFWYWFEIQHGCQGP